MKTTQQTLLECLAEQAGKPVDQVKPEHKLDDDLMLDSLDTVELMMTVEDQFRMEIPDAVVDGLDAWTVQQFVDTLAAHIEAQQVKH